MKKPKDNKIGVYIFRLPKSKDDSLVDVFTRRRIVGVTSKHQFARKLVMDYLSGRLVYLKSSDANDNPLISLPEAVADTPLIAGRSEA
jgi:hypothetical protein